MKRMIIDKSPLLISVACACTMALQAQQTPEAPKAPPAPKPQTIFAPIPEAALAAIEKAVPTTALAKPSKPRRILVFYRTEGFVHKSIPYGNEMLKLLGSKSGAFTADFSNDMAAFDPGALKAYDAVLFNNTTQLKFENPEHRKTLLDFISGGKGLIGLHAGSDNFPKWPEAQALLGGVFHGHPWGAGDQSAVKVDEPKHPINRGFDGKGFWIREEIYQIVGDYSRDRQRVLLSLDMSKPQNKRDVDKNGKKIIVRTDDDFPISWIKKDGGGRVFYSSLGHREDIYIVPQILKHFLDGIQYALGDLNAEDAPSSKISPAVAPSLAPDEIQLINSIPVALPPPPPPAPAAPQ